MIPDVRRPITVLAFVNDDDNLIVQVNSRSEFRSSDWCVPAQRAVTRVYRVVSYDGTPTLELVPLGEARVVEETK
jgi:hypothetical protein